MVAVAKVVAVTVKAVAAKAAEQEEVCREAATVVAETAMEVAATVRAVAAKAAE